MFLCMPVYIKIQKHIENISTCIAKDFTLEYNKQYITMWHVIQEHVVHEDINFYPIAPSLSKKMI